MPTLTPLQPPPNGAAYVACMERLGILCVLAAPVDIFQQESKSNLSWDTDKAGEFIDPVGVASFHNVMSTQGHAWPARGSVGSVFCCFCFSSAICMVKAQCKTVSPAIWRA